MNPTQGNEASNPTHGDETSETEPFMIVQHSVTVTTTTRRQRRKQRKNERGVATTVGILRFVIFVAEMHRDYPRATKVVTTLILVAVPAGLITYRLLHG